MGLSKLYRLKIKYLFFSGSHKYHVSWDKLSWSKTLKHAFCVLRGLFFTHIFNAVKEATECNLNEIQYIENYITRSLQASDSSCEKSQEFKEKANQQTTMLNFEFKKQIERKKPK